MRRPEGFDAPSETSTEAPRTARARRSARKTASPVAPEETTGVAETGGAETGGAPETVTALGRGRFARSRALVTEPVAGAPRLARSARAAAANAKRAERALRRAEAARRRYERDEVRRFTRRARRRRAIAWSVGATFALLFVLVAVAVFSPALALKTVRLEGATRVDAATLQAALDEQLGTPLALVDEGRIVASLEQFPLIRSFVIERVPPDTIVVRITEREPVAAMASPDGYDLVDPAGVSVLTSPTAVDGVPLVDVRGQGVDSVAFRSVIEVLLSMPAELRARVVQVTAASRDDVTLSLSGVGQTVAWGSADDSALKARVLATLMTTVDPGRAGEFDVSAPTIAIFRPA